MIGIILVSSDAGSDVIVDHMQQQQQDEGGGGGRDPWGKGFEYLKEAADSDHNKPHRHVDFYNYLARHNCRNLKRIICVIQK